MDASPVLPLVKRADFLAVQAGKKIKGRFFALAYRKRKEVVQDKHTGTRARFGLTVTRKNGNAVARNRIKRRLRAALRAIENSPFVTSDTDYVIIAYRESLEAPFLHIVQALQQSIQKAAGVKAIGWE